MRWRLACDTCGAAAWVGGSATGFDAWCEACQRSQTLPAAPGPGTRCARCGARLPAAPRFVELWGMLQHLDAVLAAWGGDPAPLATLLPERPVFLSDLDPPAAGVGDPAALRAQLAALARGDWRAVLVAPTEGARAEHGSVSRDPRADAARAIAHERAGEPAAAIAAWDAVLASGEDERARLARGSLLARAGRRAEAAQDLARAGGSFAARWDRAALLVIAAVDDRAGSPDAGVLARARAEAGEASAYWSDPTVGRLLFSLLVARTLAGYGDEPRRASDADANARSLLRAAEAQLEHDTFWDRALLLAGWVRVGAPEEAARVGSPLARGEALALAAEPAIAGAALAEVARALAGAIEAIDAGEPARARQAIAGALARVDLRAFRLPCAGCGRGSIGIDEVCEALTGEA